MKAKEGKQQPTITKIQVDKSSNVQFQHQNCCSGECFPLHSVNEREKAQNYHCISRGHFWIRGPEIRYLVTIDHWFPLVKAC